MFVEPCVPAHDSDVSINGFISGFRDAGNGTVSTPAAGAPTVTISGGPDPTVGFATTYPPSANGVSSLRTLEGARMQLLSLASVMAVCLLGGAWTVL